MKNYIPESKLSELKTYLGNCPDVVFAYQIGSSLEHERFRDIDLAIFFSSDPGLLRVGEIISELSIITCKDIDVVTLNGLPFKHPILAYEVYSKGYLLLSNDENEHLKQRSLAMSVYMDTQPLRELMQQSFEKRVKSKNFAKRDYV